MRRSGSGRKRPAGGVRWDEQNLQENEVIKSTITKNKITEPKTPYHGPLGEEHMADLQPLELDASPLSLDAAPSSAPTPGPALFENPTTQKPTITQAPTASTDSAPAPLLLSSNGPPHPQPQQQEGPESGSGFGLVDLGHPAAQYPGLGFGPSDAALQQPDVGLMMTQQQQLLLQQVDGQSTSGGDIAISEAAATAAPTHMPSNGSATQMELDDTNQTMAMTAGPAAPSGSTSATSDAATGTMPHPGQHRPNHYPVAHPVGPQGGGALLLPGQPHPHHPPSLHAHFAPPALNSSALTLTVGIPVGESENGGSRSGFSSDSERRTSITGGSDGDSSSSEARRAFEERRKAHYNMRAALREARVLLSEDGEGEPEAEDGQGQGGGEKVVSGVVDASGMTTEEAVTKAAGVADGAVDGADADSRMNED